MSQLLRQSGSDGANIAGTHGQQKIAVCKQALKHRQKLLRRLDEYRFDAPTASDGARNRPTVSTRDRIFAGRKYLEQDYE